MRLSRVRFPGYGGAIRLRVGVLALTLIVPVAALAASYRYLSTGSPVTTTGVSGYADIKGTLLSPNPADGWILHGIEYAETSDEARHLRGHFVRYNELLSSFDHREYETVEVSLDNKSPGLGGWKKVIYYQSSQTLHSEAISAIKICTTDKKKSDDNKLKGIEVRSTEVTYNSGTASVVGNPKSVRQTNCEKWHPLRKCAAGEVAVGLEYYFQRSPDVLRGLALRCAPVSLKTLSSD